MQIAAQNQDFELAARLRDQLIDLRKIQEQHASSSTADMDVIAITQQDGVNAIEVLFIRNGKQVGQEFILPKNSTHQAVEVVLCAFLPLYYLGKDTPKQLLVSHKIKDKKTISDALNTHLIDTPNKDKKHYLNIAKLTVKENLNQNLLARFRKKSTLVHLQSILNLKKIPEYIECFDISHMMGEATKASCVVFEKGVPKVKKYRQFDIKNVTPGDDYAAMNQVIFRRYSKLLKEQQPLPDLVLIDGGLGQLNQAIMVMNSIGIDDIQLVGVAKGEKRKAGLETLITVEDSQVNKINLAPHDPALMLVNHIRDESHRFAIKNHRLKRSKKRTTSPLEAITGVGKLRRSALLNYFGGLQEIKNASIDEIQKVNGINLALATKIAQSLNSSR